MNQCDSLDTKTHRTLCGGNCNRWLGFENFARKKNKENHQIRRNTKRKRNASVSHLYVVFLFRLCVLRRTRWSIDIDEQIQ